MLTLRHWVHDTRDLVLSVTPWTNVAFQVVWGTLSISGVKAPWASSLTSSSKRYCTSNVVSHDCVSMCTKKDYGLHCHLLGTHIFNKHLILFFRLAQILAPRSLRKILTRQFLIITSLQHSTNSTWVGVLISTVCPLSRHGRFPSVLPAASTSTGVSNTTSNRNQVAFCRCIRFCKESIFVTGHARGFPSGLPENGFYEDHTTLVVILCRNLFPQKTHWG